MNRSAILPTARRFRAEPYYFCFAVGKLSLDPAYPHTARLLASSPRPLLDIGCGMGLLAAYLRHCGHQPSIVGLDIDAEKVTFAQGLLGNDNARFIKADGLDLPEHEGDVVMLDVLHYFNDEDQQLLLEKIVARLAPGGTALIRVTLREKSWRFALSQFEEEFIRVVRWIPVLGSNFPTKEEILAPFEKAGIECHVQPMWGRTPFNSYLFTLQKPAAS